MMSWTAKSWLHVEIRHLRAAHPSQPQVWFSIRNRPISQALFSELLRTLGQNEGTASERSAFQQHSVPTCLFFEGDPGRHPVIGEISPILTGNFSPSPVSWAGIVSASWRKGSRPGQGMESEERTALLLMQNLILLHPGCRKKRDF